MKYAITEGKQPVSPISKDFLGNLLSELEATRPDFSKFAEFDEAIVEQVDDARPLTYRFIDAANIAAKAECAEALRTMYEFFGGVLRLYDLPDDFRGRYDGRSFDGFKFLGYEMFVGLVASMLRYGHWSTLGELLDEDLFVQKKQDSEYEEFVRVSRHVASLDQTRNERLNLKRICVMGDMLKERFTNTELSELLTHKEFLEADYFLFMRTVCHSEDLESMYNIWCPRASVLLDHVPWYLPKAESMRFLLRMLPATGFEKPEQFVESFKANHGAFEAYFRSGIWKRDPLGYFDLSKLGSRK